MINIIKKKGIGIKSLGILHPRDQMYVIKLEIDHYRKSNICFPYSDLLSINLLVINMQSIANTLELFSHSLMIP